MIPQPLVELHGWGRAAGTMSHLAQIDSVADAVSALRKSDSRGVVPRGREIVILDIGVGASCIYPIVGSLPTMRRDSPS